MSTGRLEAFSDGVIAVAITLLVLDITVPPSSRHTTLTHNLAREWPHYAAYATSFITIGIIWVNHHVMISRLRTADHVILMLNLVLLMTIALIPFGTSLLAAYVTKPEGQHLAAAVYGGTLLAMSLAFSSLNYTILLRKAHMMHTELPREERRRIFSRSVSGIPPYVLATAIAPVSAVATLAITAAIAVFYAFPIGSGTRSRSRAEDTPGRTRV